MRSFLFLLSSISIIVLAVENRKLSSIDLTSANEIAFYAKKNFEFSQIGKIPEYQGILIQLNEASTDLNAADLYQFLAEDKIKMDQNLCVIYLEKIFGQDAPRSLKLKNGIHLFHTPVGNACDFQLTDTYQQAQLAHRYTIIGFVHGRLVALVWSLREPPQEKTKVKLQDFWKTLK